VGPDLRWSARRGRLEDSTVFGPVLEYSSDLLGVLFSSRADSWVGPCRGWFIRPFLHGDVFPLGGEVDGLAYPQHWPIDHSCQSRGQVLPVWRCPVLSLLISGGTCQKEETSQGVVTWWRVCPLRYLSYGILHMVNGFYQAVFIP
jgi:hypothetical protein